MLDPAARAIVEATNQAPPFDEIGVEAARRAVAARPRPVVTPVASVSDASTADRDGVPVRIYRASDTAGLPVVVFAHGGGWVVGSIESADETCRRLSRAGQCVVVSVEYRMAPEHPHPAAVVDVLRVLDWLAARGEALGLSPEQVYLAGESSGAHTVLSAAMERRHDIAGLLLVCPPIDPAMASASWVSLGDEYIPRRSQMQWMWAMYRGAQGEYAEGAPDPLDGELGGLPSTVLVVAEYDPLRDEALTLADRLQEAGVPVSLFEAEGQLHPVTSYAPVIPACQQILDDATRSLLSGRPRGSAQ